MNNTKKLDESVGRKVRKALALARNNSSEHESQTAMLMAQKIMAQYGLTMQDVVEKIPQEKKVIHGEATNYGRNQWWKKTLSAIIAENFRCFSYNGKQFDSSRKLIET